jgi:hypothetical protein
LSKVETNRLKARLNVLRFMRVIRMKTPHDEIANVIAFIFTLALAVGVIALWYN